MDKEKEINSVPEGFLHEDVFREKYNTTFEQMHPESFLDTVLEDDRDNYEDFEILTGKNRNNQFNPFNNWGKRNAGKKYDKSKTAFDREVARWNDGLVDRCGLTEILDKMLEQAKAGSFKHQQFLFERIRGKVADKLEVKSEGAVKVDLNIPPKFNKKKDD